MAVDDLPQEESRTAATARTKAAGSFDRIISGEFQGCGAPMPVEPDLIARHQSRIPGSQDILQREFLLAVLGGSAEAGRMKGFGKRLRERAKELGLTDSEVARRLGLSQTRYSGYVNEVHEPDLATLARIVGVLGMSADRALGIGTPASDDPSRTMRTRIALAVETIDGDCLAMVAAMLDAASKQTGRNGGSGIDAARPGSAGTSEDP